VKLHDLLRNPVAVFAELETDGEPILITRDGTPIGLLTPVGYADALGAAMAALPEFIERRKRADLALSEGRIVPSADVLARLQESPTAGKGSGVSGVEE
jgi:antitoxin (DNA-binding transcriptional repressor) of toxin-antitoxin stability system